MRNRRLIGFEFGQGDWLRQRRLGKRPLERRRCGASGEQHRDHAGHHAGLHHVNRLLTLAIAIGSALALGSFMPARAQIVEPLSSPYASPIPPPPSRPVPKGAAVAISLTEAVALGLRDNRTIKSAYLSRIAQKFDLFVAGTRFRPRISVAADVFRAWSGGVSSTQSNVTPQVGVLLPTGANAGFSWARNDRFQDGQHFASEVSTFSVSQPLLRGAGPDINLAPIRRARLQERINQLGLKNTVSNAVSSIVFAYRGLVQAQEQVRLAELALKRTRDLLETNRALIAAGRMAAADIVQTESGVANQEVAVLQAGQTRTSAQLALLQLLALDLSTNIVAGDSIDTGRVAIDLDKALELGRSARMDLLSSELAVEQGRISLREAKNNRLWDLSATGSVSRFRGSDALRSPLDGDTDKRVGLTLNIPIGGDYAPRQGEINATVALRQAEIAYQDTSQAAESQIRDAVQSVEASWLQLEAARRARNLAARALDIQREKLNFGRASNFEVLSFEADLRAADAQELSAKINYLNQLTSLDQQIGSTLDTWKIDLND